jgi:hypothetical protein
LVPNEPVRSSYLRGLLPRTVADRIGAWILLVAATAGALHYAGHIIGVTRPSPLSAIYIAIALATPLMLGALGSFTGVRKWPSSIALALVAALIYVIALGFNAMDDPGFCPSAPASECLGFSIAFPLITLATAGLFGLGWWLPKPGLVSALADHLIQKDGASDRGVQ